MAPRPVPKPVAPSTEVSNGNLPEVPQTRATTRRQTTAQTAEVNIVQGTCATDGSSGGSKSLRSNGKGRGKGKGKGKAVAVAPSDSCSVSQSATAHSASAVEDFDVDVALQEEELDDPLEAGERLSLPSDLMRGTADKNTDRDALIATLTKRLREQEELLKRTKRAGPVDLLTDHQAKRARTDKRLPDPSVLRMKMATNSISGRPPIPRPPALNLASKASKNVYDDLSFPSSTSPSPHTPSLGSSFTRQTSRFRTPAFISNQSMSPSLSSEASKTPPPMLSPSAFAGLQPAAQLDPSSEPVSSGLINSAKPYMITSYDAEYQSVLSHAKHYLHLWLVIDDAFPDQMKREAIVKSAVEYANEDFSEIPDVSLTEAIKTMLRQHVSRARNKWKAHAQAIVPAAYSLEASNGPDANKIRAAFLLEKYRWTYGIVKPAIRPGQKEKRARGFGHPAITQLIIASVFGDKQGVAHLRPDKLRPIPLPMLAFAALVLRNSLEEFTRTGTRINVDMEAKTYGQHYQSLIKNVNQFEILKNGQSLELRMGIWKQGAVLIKHEYQADDDQPEEEYVLDDTESEDFGEEQTVEERGTGRVQDQPSNGAAGEGFNETIEDNIGDNDDDDSCFDEDSEPEV